MSFSLAKQLSKPIDTHKDQPSSEIRRRTILDSEKPDEPATQWEVVPEPEEHNHHQSTIVWEVLETDGETLIPTSRSTSNSVVTPPSNLKEAEEMLNTIPLQSSDFKPLLDLSHAVPTASVLSHKEWRLMSRSISPFKYANETSNKNYAVRIDYGLQHISNI